MRSCVKVIRSVLFVFCVVLLLILLGLRLKYLRETSNGDDFDLLLSNEEEHNVDIPFPSFTICNANPARGSSLFVISRRSPSQAPLYEYLVDAKQRRLANTSIFPQNMSSLYNILQETSHDMAKMLVDCRVGLQECTSLNFSQRILPTGSCYTFTGKPQIYDTVHLELDPEVLEYIIPNNGHVGFRLLIHDKNAAFWIYHRSSVFLGTQFHTNIRIMALRKIHESACISQAEWTVCLENCLQERIYQHCGCYFKENESCSLPEISACSVPIEVIQSSLNPSSCDCVRPCEHVLYTHESVTQAWQPSFPSLFRFTDSRPSSSQAFSKSNPMNDWQSSASMDAVARKGRKQPAQNSQMAGLIQLWAFLREANMEVFQELRTLEVPLQSLYRITEAVQQTVRQIERATYMSRSGDQGLIANWYRPLASEVSDLREDEQHFAQKPQEQLQQIFDENCVDQTEHIGMLHSVSRLSKAFTDRLKSSFLFQFHSDGSSYSTQLNLINILLVRSTNDFQELLNDLRINDLLSDVTMLDLRRKGQKCLDAAFSLSELLKNDTYPVHWDTVLQLRNATTHQKSENVISLLQTMLLSTDAHLKRLSFDFARLYKENQYLVKEMRALISYQISVEHRYSRVSVSIKVSSRQSQSFRLKSTSVLFNRKAVFLDILSSTVLVMAFIFLLAENLYANLWRKRGMRRKRVSVNFRRLGLNHAHTQPKRNESNERKHMASACGDETVSSTDSENGGRLLQAYKLHSRDGPPAFIYNLPSHPVSLSNAVGLTAASVTLPKCSSHAGIQGVSVLMDRIPRSVERSRTALTAQPSPLMQGGSRLTASTPNASITADAQTPSFEIRHARHPMWPIYEVTNNQVLPTPVTTVNSAEAFTMDVV